MNISARDLRAVLALVDEGSFTAAARRLHLSQSAFSTLVQGIESALGARLFDRSTRRVQLTPDGEIFERSARRVLQDLDGLVDDFRAHAQMHKGRVSLAALPSLSAGWLPGVLARFRGRFPGIELVMFDALSDQCLALLRGGQVELALASAGPDEVDLATTTLCTDRFNLVCPRGHPLAGRVALRVVDLAAYPFIHLARNSSVRQHLDAAFHPQQLRAVAEVEHLATVAGLVEAGLGITVVPELTLFHFRRPGLVIRPVTLPGLVRRIFIVKQRNRSLSSAAQALHDLMLAMRPRPARTRRT
ncbi:MAG: LysR family transcriptional regulator [Burkholderiaceae bacterium]|nr:LysR family transcriptional regulator [Burkholderiaceae bacterium]